MFATKKAPFPLGNGQYYHVEVRPKTEFSAFYTEDVGRRKHSMLVLGKQKKDDKWATHKWLISKGDAYISDRGELKSEDHRIQQILDYVDGNLVHKERDTFYIRPHRNIKLHKAEKQHCSIDECPEMYFENYEDYENYVQEKAKQPSYLE